MSSLTGRLQKRYGPPARQEWSRITLGARRAAACTVVASVWVGAWLGGVWWLGSRWVYRAEGLSPIEANAALAAPAREPPERQIPALAPRATASPDARGSANIQRVAGLDLPPFAPRHAATYGLDERSRAVTGACPAVTLTDFAGERVPLAPAARVAPEFRERLVELDEIVEQLSLVFYGRAPSAILVASSFDCRSVSGRSRRLSEHSLGNAIDITGFRFAARQGATPGSGFEVRVAQHWKASGSAELERHARFLDVLTQALLARDVFRTLLGPSHPDHADHFHFDMAPSHFVNL